MQTILMIVVVIVGMKIISNVLFYEEEWDELKRKEFHDLAYLYLKDKLWPNFEEKEQSGENMLYDNSGIIPIDHPHWLWLKNLQIGSFVDALDFQNKWYSGMIVDVESEGNQVQIHFDDWEHRWNEWVSRYSGRLAPPHTHSLGGKLHGGMPGWPLIPPQSTSSSLQQDPFSQMLLEFETKGKMLPDALVRVDKNEIWTPHLDGVFIETGARYNNRAVYQNVDNYLYYAKNNCWMIGPRIGDTQTYVAKIQWDGLRPDLLSQDKKYQTWYWSSQIMKTKETNDVPTNAISVVRRRDIPFHLSYHSSKKANLLTVLPNQVHMPRVTLGTMGLNDQMLVEALKLGYRAFDTGAKDQLDDSGHTYVSQSLISQMFKQYPRTTLFLSTRIPAIYHGYHSTIGNFMSQLEALGTNYIDLVFVDGTSCPQHVQCEGDWLDTYQALEHLYQKSMIRAIGVSGFNAVELDTLTKHQLRHVPLGVVRGWHDPLHTDWEVIEWCRKHNIPYQARSAMGGGHLSTKSTVKSNPLLLSPVIKRIARGHSIFASDTLLKWYTHDDIAVVIRSNNPRHLQLNLETLMLNTVLTTEEIHAIDEISLQKFETEEAEIDTETPIDQISNEKLDDDKMTEMEKKEKEIPNTNTNNKPNKQANRQANNN